MHGKVYSINISSKKGTTKENVQESILVENYGIEGDAHASSSWHRQVSLIDIESIEKFNARPDNRNHPCQKDAVDAKTIANVKKVKPGDFAENITTQGVTLSELPIGAKLKMGDSVILEITQIGKTCHKGCEIRRLTGDCIMPKKGIFTKVIRGGKINVGDPITVLKNGF